MYLAKFYLEISGKWYPASHMDMEHVIKKRQCPVRVIFESVIKKHVGKLLEKKSAIFPWTCFQPQQAEYHAFLRKLITQKVKVENKTDNIRITEH